MRYRRNFVVVPLIAAFCLVSLGSVPATAQSSVDILARGENVTVLRDGDWVRHNFLNTIPGSTTIQLNGERLLGPDGSQGCIYSGSETELPSTVATSSVRVDRQIAHNAQTCQLILESATLTRNQAMLQGFRVSPPSNEVSATAARSSTNLASALNSAPRSRTTGTYQKLYYEDPLQIDVTSVTARVRWTYNGTCTTNSQHSASWGWYSPSGWKRTAHSWDHDLSCEYGATTVNSGTYRNSVFCATVDTWNRYYVNYVQGLSNGSVRYEWNHQAWGGCTNLLSFHRVTGYWGG